MYVCNCNGIRARDVRAVIDQGGCKPVHVFRHCQSKPQCAKCLPDMRRMIEAQRETLKIAAE